MVALGWLFFAVSVVQAVSVALAPLLARRFGLVATMVGTHLPSNVLLAAVALAPAFPVAAVLLLLLARTTLSQMECPPARRCDDRRHLRRKNRCGGGHQRRPVHGTARWPAGR